MDNQCASQPPREGHRINRDGPHRKKNRRNVGNGYSEDVVLLATSLATQIARGRTECELETLINVVDVLGDALIGILAQRRICNRQRLEILQDDFIV